MNPLDNTKALRDSLISYLEDSAFPVEAALAGSNDITHLPDKLHSFLNGEDTAPEHSGAGFVSPLFIERQIPYANSVNALTQIQDLDEDVAKAFAAYLIDNPDAKPNTIHLYEHQERAFDAVMRGGNLVVCTGTGSGKTECFLLPIVNAIVKEKKQAGNNWRAGVRAMVLYPMNALVNDQIRRLRHFIQFLPENLQPTFGLFTGDLKPNEKEIREDKLEHIRNDFQNASFTFSESYNQGIINSDIPLKSQYTHRWEWAENRRGPADILVTNYSMLERLLLLPKHTSIFSIHTWRFIVLDEAHSYTGSNGTEIAWLIRRLVHRVQEQNQQLQYIATSATLKDGEDDEVKRFIKEEFASKLFPAAAETFHVELGSYQGEVHSNNIYYQGDLVALRNSKLYQDTVNFLQKKKSISIAKKIATFIEQLLNNKHNKWNAKELYYVFNSLPTSLLEPPNNSLEGQGIPLEGQLIKFTNNINLLIKFAIDFYGESQDDWADYLHNDLDPRKRQNIQQNRNRDNDWARGNRLELLANWKLLRQQFGHNHNIPALTMGFESFDYLYSRCLDAENDLPEDIIPYSLEDIEIELSDVFVQRLRSYIDSTSNDINDLASNEIDLTRQWREKFGDYSDTSLEDLIYRALSTRPEILRIKNEICNRPGCHSWSEMVQQLYGNELDGDEKLQALLELSMIGTCSGERFPLLDIRYHQMVRGIAENELAVEFPNGQPQNLTLHRTLDSNWGHESNFLFTLGACRDCGMPFLLAYSDTANLTINGFHSPLVRDFSEKYSFLHAFALCCGGEQQHLDMDATTDNQDGTGNVNQLPILYLNLQSGEYSTTQSDGMQRVYWYRHGSNKRKDTHKFIDKCPNCNGIANTSTGATYGIITPYSSTEEASRLVILREFAELAEDDIDPVVRSKPGAGKKVLAFSDSRSGAATTAYRFHNLFSRSFLNKVVVECVNEIQNPQRNIDQERERMAEQFRRQHPQFPANLIEQMVDAQIHNPIEVRPSLSEVAELLLKKAQEQKFMYLLLMIDNTQPSRYLSKEDGAVICVLKTLRDFYRRGIVKSHQVKMSFMLPAGYQIDNLPFFSEEQKDAFNNHIQELINRIFNKMWWTMEIEIPENWNESYVDSRPNRMHCYARQHAQGGERLNGAGGRYPDINSFAGNANKHILEQYVNEFCPDAPQLTNQAKIDILERIRASLETQANQYSLLENNVDAGGWGMSLTYLKNNLLLYPSHDNVVDEQANEIDEQENNIPLRIEEHTAQLTARRGRVYQQAFAQGDINILSCSTTFEMGIDVGGVNRVFLMTVPPGTANYKQRAGRAGRRPGAAAFILNYAGSQAQDAYYFSHPEELYGGKIEPPHIYLEKKTFRARHLRAVALACFLQWMINQPECRNGDWWERRWERSERFFFGYRTGPYDRQQQRYEIQNLNNPSALISLLPRWRNDPTAQASCRTAICGIADIGAIDPLFVMNDLLFQIGGVEMCQNMLPYSLTEENARNYQELCGPNLLEKQNHILVESTSPMRQNVLKRLDYRLRNLLEWNGTGYFTIPQKNLMLRHPFEVFSELNIIPKYGFPVDVITLFTGRNTPIDLSRDLSIGLYEYAPEQIVYADKRAYKSIGFTSDAGTQGLKLGEGDNPLWECSQCHHFYQQQGNGICPKCGLGSILERTSKSFTKPTKFRSKQVIVQDNRKPRGMVQQMYCGGIYQGYRLARDCALVVGESDTQLMRYINAGVDGCGFKPNLDADEDEKQILFHEVITNIAIWSIPEIVFNELFPSDSQRGQAALRSAKYAIQISAAHLLNIEEKDLGVLVQKLQGPAVPRCRESFILFDNASGGGGMVLPLYNPDAPEIRQIIENAYNICRNCTCGGNRQPDINCEPMPLPSYRAELQANHELANKRPVVSCSSCLKMYSNRKEHQNLDRWDAAFILGAILERRIQEGFQQVLPPGYIPYDGHYPLQRGRGYCLADGRCLICGAFSRDELEQNRNQIGGMTE